jgi:hypothetical protein
MTNQLQPGNYMKVTPVRLFLAKHFPIQEMNANKLPKHEGEFDVYFQTSDLKTVMNESQFRELECEVITHMILSETEKKSYYNNSLSYDQIAKR